MKAKTLLLNFNKLKGNKTFKALFLACLMGVVPSCKQEFNEPTAPNNNSGKQYSEYSGPNNVDSYPVDSFMKHMPNVEYAKFYQPTEDNHEITFQTNSSTFNVNGSKEKCDVSKTSPNIIFDINLTRADNQSVNGSANFNGPAYWGYSVSYTRPDGERAEWTIENATDANYATYSAYDNTTLANKARTRILSKDQYNVAHADSIYNNIMRGNGVWQQEAPFNVKFNSKGAQQDLRYSDFGTLEYSESGSNPITKMYTGGMTEGQSSRYSVPATTFKATAFGNVKRTKPNDSENYLVLTTGKDSATYTIDEAKNETIVMPFQNWYKVTIIRTANSVVSYIENPTSPVPQQWQVIHPDLHEYSYQEKVQPNGLFATDGMYTVNSQEGIHTGLSALYYLDDSGYMESVIQGYRQDYTNTDGMVFTFCLGGTNRPDQGTATGLDLIYCAPSRQR